MPENRLPERCRRCGHGSARNVVASVYYDDGPEEGQHIADVEGLRLCHSCACELLDSFALYARSEKTT